MPDPTQRPDPNPMLTGAAQGGADWNSWARENANAAINQANNNPFSQMAQGYAQKQLTGDLSNNPFMNTLYGTLRNTSMDEANQYLRDFLGPNSSSSSSGGGSGSYSGTPIGDGSWRGSGDPNFGSGARFVQGGGGGGALSVGKKVASNNNTNREVPPDTVGGSDSFFAQKIKDLFDAKRLDPANDPTMQPFIEAMRRENQENILSNLADINARMEGAGRFGGSLYAALDRGAREEGIESLDNAMSQAMLQSREAALQRQMEGLGQVNTRDIAAMNDATQRYGIDQSRRSASAGAAAAAESAANAQKLQAISMLMQGSQFGLGLMGDLAGTMSNNQLGVMNAGLGYGQLGQTGYQNAQGFGNLGLQGLGLQANIGQNIMNLNEESNRFNRQQDWTENIGNRQQNWLENIGTRQQDWAERFGTRQQDWEEQFGTRQQDWNEQFGTRQQDWTERFGTREQDFREQQARQAAEAQAAAARAEEERWRWQQQMEEQNAQQDALNDYFNILMGIGGMGGDAYSESPGQYADPGLGDAAPWMAGIGSLANNWSGMSNLFNRGSGGGGGGYTPSASSRGGGDFYFEP